MNVSPIARDGRDAAPEAVAPEAVILAPAQTVQPTCPTEEAERPVKQAIKRGWRRRCPNCGAGPLLRGYLTVRRDCPVCDEPLHHHRADDGPAYLTILIVGHIMAPLILWAFVKFRPDPVTLATAFTIGCVALSLYLLPRLKGVIVGIQWAKRMHGFAQAPVHTPVHAPPVSS